MDCVSVPHHITSIFIPYTIGPPERQGSIGAGIVVGPEATACVSSETRLITGTAEKTLRLLGWRGEPGIRVVDPLPPGAGYSVSASTSLAAGILYASLAGASLGRAYMEAHKAEVLSSTGLGDVLALSCGTGIAVRTRPGPPGVGSVDCTPLPGNIAILSFNVGTESTRDLISGVWRWMDRAMRRLDRIIESPSLETFIEESQRYTLETGAHRVFRDAERLHRTPGLIGFYFKKRVAVVIVEGDMARDAVEYLEGLGVRVRILVPARYPYCLGGCR